MNIPQTEFLQQRFMCIANAYSYFTHHDLIPGHNPNTHISPTITEIEFDLMSKW